MILELVLIAWWQGIAYIPWLIKILLLLIFNLISLVWILFFNDLTIIIFLYSLFFCTSYISPSILLFKTLITFWEVLEIVYRFWLLNLRLSWLLLLLLIIIIFKCHLLLVLLLSIPFHSILCLLSYRSWIIIKLELACLILLRTTILILISKFLLCTCLGI